MSEAPQRNVTRHQQLPLNLGARLAYGRADFLIGPENRDAVGWIDRWPDWPAPLLVITGPAASGKSHLAAVWRDISRAEVIRPDLLATRSADEIAGAAENIVLDGIDLWIGTVEAEETLFHLYNIFKEEGRSMLITSRMPPSRAEFAIADIASRMRAAPLAAIRPPEDTLLASVLIKLFSDRQLSVTNDIINYILPRMERSFDAAREIVARADEMALAQRQKISIPLMRRVMMEMQQPDLF